MVTLSFVAEIINGDRSASYPSGKDFVSYGIPFINAGHLDEGKVDFSDMDYITQEKYNHLSGAKIRRNDILLCLRGSLGKYAVSNFDEGAPASSIAIIRPNDRKINTKYLTCIISSHIFQKQIELENNGSSQPNLSATSVSNFLIPLPSLPEQKRIAEALSDTDDMISSLEKLIEKKKAIKQGAMQDLLTGKKRLPGFKGQWNTINLSKKSKIKARIGWQGLTTNEYLDDGYAYLVTGTDFVNGKIDWDGCHYVAKDRFDQDKNIQIRNNDVLITKDGSLGKTALVKGLNKPATLNSGVFVIKPIQEAYDPTFVYYILSSFVFKDFLDHLSAGSTIIHLYQKDINKFEFLVPPTVEEQTAIASILSDMDSETEELEQKLNKTIKLKQGMMQQLLTGKIRLV